MKTEESIKWIYFVTNQKEREKKKETDKFPTKNGPPEMHRISKPRYTSMEYFRVQIIHPYVKILISRKMNRQMVESCFNLQE